jgi:hypothetical protein
MRSQHQTRSGLCAAGRKPANLDIEFESNIAPGCYRSIAAPRYVGSHNADTAYDLFLITLNQVFVANAPGCRVSFIDFGRCSHNSLRLWLIMPLLPSGSTTCNPSLASW